jgi:flagellin
MRINNNVAAANASRNLAQTSSATNRNIEKLSTGRRINRAGDDASGLVISNQLRAQVSALRQATRNAQDGISVLQTAEGALNEVSTMLNRMRDLAVQASNSGTNGQSSRDAGQAELAALRVEIDRISSTTRFGSVNLLDGNFGTGGTANVAGALDADGMYAITTATSVLTLAFGGALSGLGTVTANLTAQTVNFASTAAEIQSKLRSTLLAGTASQAEFASRLTVTGAASGAGSVLTVRVEGVTSGASVTLGGAALTPLGLSATAVTVTNAGSRFQVGAGTSAEEQITLAINDTSSTALNIGTIAINTDDTTTNAAIAALDLAITQVSAQRGELGALQNRFESMVANLATTTENLTASESRIRDVDMAAEMVEFTKNQVLSQAGMAMLAQANQIPQGILSLLKG